MTTKTDFSLYKRLLNYVWPHWHLLAVSMVFMAVLAATNPALAVLMKYLLDDAFIEKDPNITAIIPFLFAGIFSLQAIAIYIYQCTLRRLANRVIMDLRLVMFKQVINFPNHFFDNNSTGNLIAKFTNNTSNVKTASSSAISVLIRDSLSIAGLLAWIFYINWQLTLICLISLPLIVLMVSIIRKRVRKLAYQGQESIGDFHRILHECLDAQQLIKIYGGQKTEQQKFFNAVNMQRRLNNKLILATTASSPIVQIITAIILAVVIYVATQSIYNNTLSVGGFISFLTASIMLLGPLKRLAALNEHLQIALAACDSIFQLIDAEVEPQQQAKELINPKGDIAFKAICFRYPNTEKVVLKSVTLTIAAGKTVALVGKSGSGKTTLASLLPRFYQPQSGTIYYDDTDISELSLSSLRSNIAYVSQDIILFNDTVRNNIAYGELEGVSEQQLWAAAEAAHAIEFINALPQKMETLIGEDGVLLSGGQRQRIAIARALLKDARLLILDEATSSLDTDAEQNIQQALEKLKKGRTCLIIAHRMSTIEKADHIIVLDKGRIVEQGTHEELLAQRQHYMHLYSMQFKEQPQHESVIST